MKIKAKVALTTFVATMVPLAASLMIALWHGGDQVTALTLNHAARSVEVAGRQLSDYFDARREDIVGYARLPLVRSLDWQQTRPYFEAELRAPQARFDKLFIGLPDGSFYATSAPGNPARGGRVTDDDRDPAAPLKTLDKRHYWQYAVGQNHHGDSRTLVTKPTFSYTTGDRQLNVVSTLHSDQGRLLGLVGGSLEWGRVEALLDRVGDGLVTQFGANAELMLLAGDGTYVYHTHPDKLLKRAQNDAGETVDLSASILDEPVPALRTLGRSILQKRQGSGSFSDPKRGGEEVMVAYAPVATADYVLAVMLPKGELMGPLMRMRSGLLWTLVGAVVVVLLLSFLLAGRLVRPVRVLNDAAARFAGGQRDINLDPRGRDELADLTRNFNQLARSVSIREQLDDRRQRRLHRLSAAALAVNTRLESDAVLHALLRHAVALVDAEGGIVGRVEAGRMRVRDHCRGGAIETVDLCFGPDQGIIGAALTEPLPYLTSDVQGDPRADRALYGQWGATGVCMVPIVDSTGQVRGAFEVYNRKGGRPFDDEDLEMLQALAAVAAAAFLNVEVMEQREQALEALKDSKERLRRLAEKLSEETGQAYFRSLVVNLCAELGVEYAFVGLLDEDKTRVRTIAVQRGDAAIDNFDYALADTPCQQVVGSGVCVVASGVQADYPKDRLLQQMEIEGYAAVPLKGDNEEALGLIVVLDRNPLDEPAEKASLLQLFSVRAQAELQRHQAEEALRLAATAFETHEAIIICDAQGRIQRVNQAFTNITGYTEAEVMGRNPSLLKSGAQDKTFYKEMWRSLTERGFWQGELWNRRKDGSRYAEWLSINTVKDSDGKISHYVGAFLDLTKQKQQQAYIERSIQEEEVLSALLRLSHRGNSVEAFMEDGLQLLVDSPLWRDILTRAGVFLSTADGQALHLVAQVQLQAGRCAQCPPAALAGCLFEGAQCDPSSPDSEAEVIHFVQSVDDGPGWYRVLIRDKVLLGALVCCVPADYEPTVADENFLMRLADVLGMGVSRRLAETRIEYQAYHDELTGLPNRRLLLDRLNQELEVAKRRELHGALLFIDLDQFKRLNDALGHSIGDLLLQQVAERLRNLLRTQDTVARLGGDEFVIILPALDGGDEEAANHAYIVADKIRWGLSQLYRLGDHEFQLTPSIGIVLFPSAGESAEDLLKHADTAMYQAKKEGRNTARFYKPSMQEQANHRLAIEKDLRYAIQQEQLELHFQPQVRADGTVIGAEVLVRWRHPDRGMVSPALFIPVAEDAGLILDIGAWVLVNACRQIRRWEQAGSKQCHLAVNVSPKQFRQPNFIETVERCLAETGIDPHHLELEVTEGMLIQDIEYTIDKMAHIRELGVRFSIDDFGTGYSSLAYLKRLPLDILKIDRSFVEGVHLDAHDAAICSTIISMARHLKLAVIAEGVETREEREFLLRNGCEIYQGFYFSRPLPLVEYEAFLQACDNAEG